MAIRFSSRLSASVVAAALLFAPLVVVAAGSAQAESNEGGVFPGKSKKKKSEASLAPAIVSGKVVTTTEVVAEKNLAPMLTADSAGALQAVTERYRQIIAQGGFPKVPKGTYKKGGQSKGIVALNRRLFIEGYLRQEATEGDFAARMTSATVDALTRFQRNMGLLATGVVDGPTLAALNVPAEQRLRTIEINIPRLQTYGENLGDRYLVVNITGQQIETVNAGRVYSRHNAIVGRPERPTPVVMTALSDVNFNPYWNTPPSIIERDLIPKMTSGTKILEDMNIRVFQGFGGPEIDPSEVNWRSAVADDYHFRQEPGPTNAMATAKINFPSPFGIYLHDTPEKHLFKSGQRFYSSGCVRVEKVDLLLQWVLNGQDGIGASEIAALAETLERQDVKLATPPQLRVVYLTAWPVGNTVAFRPDVYDLDGTGFIVGQPMPVGEVADDGQRFVLKPIARKASAVDADEAEGIGLFGSRSSKAPRARGKVPASLYEAETGEVDMENVTRRRTPAPVVFVKKPGGTKTAIASKARTDKKTAKSGKEIPGLFDWAAYRKEQKLGSKNAGETLVKKKKKKPEAVKAEAADTKLKSTRKKVVPEKSVAKKIDEKDTKKVAAVEPKAASKAVAKDKPLATVDKKKPDAVNAKKVAVNCKPAADGKLPNGCKAPAEKKP